MKLMQSPSALILSRIAYSPPSTSSRNPRARYLPISDGYPAVQDLLVAGDVADFDVAAVANQQFGGVLVALALVAGRFEHIVVDEVIEVVLVDLHVRHPLFLGLDGNYLAARLRDRAELCPAYRTDIRHERPVVNAREAELVLARKILRRERMRNKYIIRR